ncbi:MAG: protein-glutamate O-methyltransferase CheR [Chloroflexi bacterium]|nr:MAG: protein-glutamate O-methyltransferase CheR [Chloroflexota bacterium]MBL1194858.1 protein-glutamate O-methyltransferase CheR [Chloroflexota bacterium]NOH12149.1 protein-glutamate O-methyltransferase CheR [Chloroflexota bacterium]
MDQGTYSTIKRSVKDILAIDLDHYREIQMQRRLDSWLARSNSTNWDDYFQVVQSTDEERDRFRAYLTINVSSFFRDTKHWDSLRETIMPELINQAERDGDPLKIWSAGCSTGEEAYSLAILMQEIAGSLPFHILASDLDQKALESAQAGGPYNEKDIENVSAEQQQRFFETRDGKYYIKPSLKKFIDFEELNLIHDTFERETDLILCRNVIIYFTHETKQKLFRKFHEALKPGGALFLGGTEFIPKPGEIGFDNWGVSVYRKPASVLAGV